MPPTTFDPVGFFEFDLAGGEVRIPSGQRVVVMSESVVAPLVGAAVRHGELTAVERWGRSMGEEVLRSLGGDVDSLTPEVVLGHVAAVIALFGWGRLHLERWGDALVARLDAVPRLDVEQRAIAALLGGLFSSLAHRDVACVPVSDEGRFLLLDPQIAEEVWTWSRKGDDLPTIVGRLAVATDVEAEE
jgi:hypothetical protein